MSSVTWATVLPLIGIVVSAAKPAMKAAALAELKTLDDAATNPLLKSLIEEVEQMVAAA